MSNPKIRFQKIIDELDVNLKASVKDEEGYYVGGNPETKNTFTGIVKQNFY